MAHHHERHVSCKPEPADVHGVCSLSIRDGDSIHTIDFRYSALELDVKRNNGCASGIIVNLYLHSEGWLSKGGEV